MDSNLSGALMSWTSERILPLDWKYLMGLQGASSTPGLDMVANNISGAGAFTCTWARRVHLSFLDCGNPWIETQWHFGFQPVAGIQ
jgi:hypothetical protein